MYIKNIRPFSVSAPNGLSNKTNRFKSDLQSDQVNRLTCFGARAVYFFCVKVNDNASADTIRIAKFIVNVLSRPFLKLYKNKQSYKGI